MSATQASESVEELAKSKNGLASAPLKPVVVEESLVECVDKKGELITIGCYARDDGREIAGVVLLCDGSWAVLYVPCDNEGYEQLASQNTSELIVSHAPPLPRTEVERLIRRFMPNMAHVALGTIARDCDGREIRIGDVIALDETPPAGGVVLAAVDEAIIFRQPDGRVEVFNDANKVTVLGRSASCITG